jgi:hypothetical protein
MDMVLGNEHTSNPSALADLNEDGDFSLQVARLQLEISGSPTPATTPAPSSCDEVNHSEDAAKADPFNSGKKVKNSKKKKDDEDEKEVISQLLRQTIDDEKTWRVEEKKWKEEAAERDGKLLNVIETLVSHLVERSSQ